MKEEKKGHSPQANLAQGKFLNEVKLEKKWFVGLTKSCQERKVGECLECIGIEHFLPIQKIRKKWSDRVKWVDKFVLRGIVFVRCTELERRKSLPSLSSRLYAYMCRDGKPIIVPDKEMEVFMTLVTKGETELQIASQPLAKGDWVLVTRGPLAGLECELTSIEGKKCLGVQLSLLGAVTLEIDTESVEKIKRPQ